ncbi:MAG: hypothetical protein KJZ79_21190 [Bryobacteraceae bacterium]|nr:hypothetical protein [Bryobacteraceae bacterium]
MSTAKCLMMLAAWLAPAVSIGQEPSVQGLAEIQRICVAEFAGDPRLVGSVRELAIAGVFKLKRFRVTEDCDKADAVLRGAVLERDDSRVRSEGESTDFGIIGGAAAAGVAAVGGAAGGTSQGLMSAETRSRASVTLRLVTKVGDVVWADTQDSGGGKAKGAIPDAVERALRQLAKDLTAPPD